MALDYRGQQRALMTPEQMAQFGESIGSSIGGIGLAAIDAANKYSTDRKEKAEYSKQAKQFRDLKASGIDVEESQEFQEWMESNPDFDLYANDEEIAQETKVGGGLMDWAKGKGSEAIDWAKENIGYGEGQWAPGKYVGGAAYTLGKGLISTDPADEARRSKERAKLLTSGKKTLSKAKDFLKSNMSSIEPPTRLRSDSNRDWAIKLNKYNNKVAASKGESVADDSPLPPMSPKYLKEFKKRQLAARQGDFGNPDSEVSKFYNPPWPGPFEQWDPYGGISVAPSKVEVSEDSKKEVEKVFNKLKKIKDFKPNGMPFAPSTAGYGGPRVANYIPTLDELARIRELNKTFKEE